MMSIICGPETKHKHGSSSFHNPTLRSFLSDLQILSSNPFTRENLMSSFREHSQLLYLSKYTLGFKPKSSSSQGRFQTMNANRITEPFLSYLGFLQQEIFSVENFLHIARFCQVPITVCQQPLPNHMLFCIVLRYYPLVNLLAS